MSGHELALALRAAYLTMHRQTDAVLAQKGVTADQFVVLMALSKADGLNLRELADSIASDRNTLRPMLVLLEKQGLVIRRSNLSDRRAWSVHISKKGRTVLKKLWQISETVRNELLSHLLEKDVKTLIRLLQKLSRTQDLGAKLKAN